MGDSTARRLPATPKESPLNATPRTASPHAPAPLQPGRDPAGARPRAVHQRPAGCHVRAEEQPHQADGRGRSRSSTSVTATRARSSSSSAAAWRTSRWTTAAVQFCTHLNGKGLVVSALQPGLERRRWQPAGSERSQNRLPVEADSHPRRADAVILENYTQVVETKDEETGKKKRKLCTDLAALPPARRGAPAPGHTRQHGAGKRYLIQHSAGSGKSNSIAWLAHQLIGLRMDAAGVFDSIIVVTDRRILDQQICATIKQFAQVGATVGHAELALALISAHLSRAARRSSSRATVIRSSRSLLDEIGNEQRGRRFAIIIDEAHSSQTGKTSAAVSMALSEEGASRG